MNRPQPPLGELALIQQIRHTWAPATAARNLILGIGDDCAILRPPRNHEVLVTTDFSLEDRHFRRNLHPPESIGHRVLARGLSDLAAMGAHPLAAFLSLALPAEILADRRGRTWLTRFFTGLRTLAAQHNTPLAGGDTSQSPTNLVLADIVLIGSAPAGRALRRGAARPGDILYVTGALGGSAAQLATLKPHQGAGWPILRGPIAKGGLPSATPASTIDANPNPHLYPQPRLAVGQTLLRRRLATAAIDLSDGLSTDLTHLCQESSSQQSSLPKSSTQKSGSRKTHLGAQIISANLPIHPLAARTADPLDLALHGGEDYELLFAAAPSTKIPRAIAGVPITRIGHLTATPGITLLDAEGRQTPLTPRGWQHFTPNR